MYHSRKVASQRLPASQASVEGELYLGVGDFRWKYHLQHLDVAVVSLLSWHLSQALQFRTSKHLAERWSDGLGCRSTLGEPAWNLRSTSWGHTNEHDDDDDDDDGDDGDEWWWVVMIDDADAKMFWSIQIFLFHYKVQYSAVYHICFSLKARKSATAATAASAPAEKAQKIEGHRSQRWFMLVLWFRCGKCAHVSEIGEMLLNCDLFTCRVFRVKGWRQLNQRFVEVHYQADVQQRTVCCIVALKNGSVFCSSISPPSPCAKSLWSL